MIRRAGPRRTPVAAADARRSGNSEELAYWSWEHKGPTASLANWGQDDAQLFRAELERALQAIALRAVNDAAPDPVQTSAGEETAERRR
jgi:hypothetical protein